MCGKIFWEDEWQGLCEGYLSIARDIGFDGGGESRSRGERKYVVVIGLRLSRGRVRERASGVDRFEAREFFVEANILKS
jgi:hypothetical protein